MTVQSPKNQNSLNIFLNNYFNIILAAFLIIIIVVVYFLVLGPKYQATLTIIKDSITEKQKLLNTKKKKLTDLTAVSNLYKKIDVNDLKKFNNVLSDDYVKETLFGEIEDIVNQKGFVVQNIGISSSGQGKESSTVSAALASSTPLSPNIGQIEITLSIAEIDYTGFRNLVRLFETNLRLFDVSQVSFSGGGNSANITLRTYYYKKNF
jgi:LPS O-antigen subunit length determinant protein (WzzB/FepE family)